MEESVKMLTIAPINIELRRQLIRQPMEFEMELTSTLFQVELDFQNLKFHLT